jgi:hypothetical protein
MDDAVLREKVSQLLSEVRQFPGAKPAEGADLAVGAESGTPGMKQEMLVLEENLDHVRLAIKYLMFDLEATKRENRLLREMLGEA